MPAIESFDEDRHAASNGYGEQAGEAPILRLVEPATRCIEHGKLPCAECDGAGGVCLVELAEMGRAA